MMFVKLFINNIYVLIGILIGIYISSLISDTFDPTCSPLNTANSSTKNIIPMKFVQQQPKKSTADPSKRSKLIRPRYYSTELGIREKLFVGIFTSDEKVNTQALHINKTIGHLVDRIKYFMTAQYKIKSKFNLTGLVGFTDTRHKYRPFQVIKYVADNFIQDYDFYFFANDYTFINVHKLKDAIKKISVSLDVYMGTRVKDASFCNLDGGILVSNSVLRSLKEHLDWCVMNAISDDHSENFGRCVHHSANIVCQEDIQNQRLESFRIRHFDLKETMLDLTKKDDFNRAVTIYPILQGEDFHLLNAYFIRERLKAIKQKIQVIGRNLSEIWPPGARPGAKPATRFDLPRQLYFNMTHMFFPDDFTMVKPHTKPDLEDIKYIVEEVKLHQKGLKFHKLINGYRKFDLSRGLDYILDLSFIDSSGRELTKRFEVSKPLGKIELLSVPYVTENSRITIILPIHEQELNEGKTILNDITNGLIAKKEKIFLLLIFLYNPQSDSKGKDDVFNEFKAHVTKVTTKYKNEDPKMAWLSIRLPLITNTTQLPPLNFAIVDLALKKVGPDALILVLDVYCNITVDFLNRVRMNTIQNYQIFNPIPFRQYNPKISQFNWLEINKNGGHFDREEYKFISFYGRDYVNGKIGVVYSKLSILARRKYQKVLPIVRTDNDISTLLNVDYQNYGNIFEMFIKFGGDLHCFRATEMSLKIKYHPEYDPKKENLFLGNENHLAKLLLNKSSDIPILI